MNFLVIDGNSLLNRAFYGIKLLTTKDGRFTNGIYGFLNVLLKLEEEYAPEAVAVAFDLRAPTFRHKMYAEYKAGRKGMPEELAQQLPVLKELLDALGYTIIEKEGYEADDILGTLSAATEDTVYLATGDRDALQLVDENSRVLLTATKMGRPQTVCYDPERIAAEYHVAPLQLIDIKALMGDASDNIPGVAGIGQKTAGDLIARFGSLDAIYADLDALDIKPGVREKLRTGKESAYLSRTLGTICREVPIARDAQDYLKRPADARRAAAMLADLEMFRMIERVGLNAAPAEAAPTQTAEAIVPQTETDFHSLLARLRSDKAAAFTMNAAGDFFFALDGGVIHAPADAADFPQFRADFFGAKEVAKYTSDCKMLFFAAAQRDEPLHGVAGDAALAGYILNPSAGDYSLARLAQEYGIALPALANEAARDAASLPALQEKLNAALAENGQTALLTEMEIPCAQVLAEMERLGFAVDKEGIRAFGTQLGHQIFDIEEEIYSLVGVRFNLNSPKQLGEALFETLGLPARKKTKTGYSTNAEVLEELAKEHPAVSRILEYRTLAKLKSTYCDGLEKVVTPQGRIHTTFQQTQTRTGRLSSTEPNLQNIPVRSELGREMRRFFRAKPGWLLVDADYSQIELRVLAHMAQDSAMLAAFNAEKDIHSITASQVFGMPPASVSPLMRSRAKAVNFGIVYGIGAFSLAEDIGVSRMEADQYIKSYLRHYHGVADYMERVVEEAREAGYVQTLYGRRRYLPELSASNFNLRAFGERVARNMPIQGTAADIIKLAMIRVRERLLRQNFAARLILQVHDELIVECPPEESEAVQRLLKEEMENAAQLDVKLVADVHVGETWFEAKG